MKEIPAGKVLETGVQSSLPVLVDIYTPHCGPCRALAPVLEELATEFSGKADFVKFDGAADNASIQACVELGVKMVPTLILFKGGKEVARRQGVTSKQNLSDWIAENL